MVYFGKLLYSAALYNHLCRTSFHFKGLIFHPQDIHGRDSDKLTGVVEELFGPSK